MQAPQIFAKFVLFQIVENNSKIENGNQIQTRRNSAKFITIDNTTIDFYVYI